MQQNEVGILRGTVRGLDRLFKNDVEPPFVTLVTGPPGSVKSGFVLTVLSSYLEKTGEFGLFATLEESVDSILKSCDSFGIELPPNLQISDYTDLREEDDSMDYLMFTERMIHHFKVEHGKRFTCFCLDSLGGLYSLTRIDDNMRKKMFHFFKLLRDHNLYSFVVMERSPGGDSHILGNEGFLCDGIINLGIQYKQGKLVRFMQVEKMRHIRHSMEKHAIEIREGVNCLGPIFDQ